MKRYTKLTIPSDSAWDRKTWRYYTPSWFNSFIDSCKNLIDWFPVIWDDRHWDDYYITKVLQRKIELQREYLVKHNRHTRIDEDNKWMTIVLNLLELEHEQYYERECFNYHKSDLTFEDIEDKPGHKSIKFTTVYDNLDEYLNKYSGVKYRVIKENKGVDFTDKLRLAMCMSYYRQQKCRNLIFHILTLHSNRWWD